MHPQQSSLKALSVGQSWPITGAIGRRTSCLVVFLNFSSSKQLWAPCLMKASMRCCTLNWRLTLSCSCGVMSEVKTLTPLACTVKPPAGGCDVQMFQSQLLALAQCSRADLKKKQSKLLASRSTAKTSLWRNDSTAQSQWRRLLDELLTEAVSLAEKFRNSAHKTDGNSLSNWAAAMFPSSALWM